VTLLKSSWKQNVKHKQHGKQNKVDHAMHTHKFLKITRMQELCHRP